MMEKSLWTRRAGLLLPLVLLLLAGCAVRPVVSGSQIDLPNYGTRVIVWGNHSGIVNEASSILERANMKVVADTRVIRVLDNQKIELSNTPDDERKILKVGKMVEADSVLFVDVQSAVAADSAAQAPKDDVSPNTATKYRVAVSVRCVGVETGEVQWQASARYPFDVPHPDLYATRLIRAAMLRGACPQAAWDETAFRCDMRRVSGRGMLGFVMGRKKTAQGTRFVVAGFIPMSPAELVGVRVGDIILSCDGKTGMQTTLEWLSTCKKEAGERTVLEIQRGGSIIKIPVVAVPRPGP